METDSFTLTDVRIFTGEAVIESGWVRVSRGLIESVGALPLPTDGSHAGTGPTLSRPGHTLLPGLIDAHIHADKGAELAIRQALRFGVTTVLDMHNEPHHVSKLKKMASEDKNVADFKSAGLAATIEGGWPEAVVTAHDTSEETLATVATWPKLTQPSEADEYVTQRIAEGSDYIKLMHESGKALGMTIPQPSAELQAAVVDAAHRRGLKVVAHALALDDVLTVLNAGVDGLTHTFYDQAPTPELVETYKRTNAWVNPTLSAIGSLTKEGRPTAEMFAHDPRVLSMLEGGLNGTVRANMCRCMGFAEKTATVEFAYETVRQLKAAGVDIICGSDSATPALGTAWGASLHQELYLLVHRCGFTPQEALHSATGVIAKRFGFGDRGLIAEGRKADLLLVEGDALKDIDNTLNIRGVWRDGCLSGTHGG